ncbi:MAG: glucose-6-phosphate dehydrogenase assembly protein OpcA [Verrucomicrobiaceae bacterium]|nr:glucose-6-phosphate dehydrogenase assembly protein OpcA [Verrucomicrobiaceae bacterium]
MRAALEDTLSILGQEVPLGRVDRELKKLWDSDEAKTRASLMNFAIYSEDAAALPRNNRLLEELTSEHACRAMLILFQPDGPAPRARAWINALCRPYEGKKIVCSEQLSFVLEGGNAAQVQNIVFAHLDSDLPLVVWWQGDLTSNFEERFYSEIDRLFIDSAEWTHPAAEFAMLEDACNGATSEFEVHDLSWTRSHFLRSALAGCFQDAVALRRLPHIAQIEITHAPGQKVAALLLAAWIAERLGLRLDDAAKEVRFSKRDGGSVSLVLAEGLAGCCVQRLALTGPDLRAEVAREPRCAFVRVCTSCDGHAREEMLPADVESEAELISSQLSRAHGTSIFIDMVPLLRRMLAKA